MKRFLILIVGIGLFASCANVVPPSGGAKDTTPPLAETSTPANNATNYQGNTVLINFDEHIQLKNINEEFYSSPPIQETPNFTIKNKALLIDWGKGSLKHNTTYVFHLGNSIADYNEGNILPNHSVLFSTGPSIDTLSISGVITGALENNPIEGALAVLYLETTPKKDSLLYLERPHYISRTNKEGVFHFKNLQEERYVLFALADEDRNLKFSLAEEFVGFCDTSVSPQQENINLQIFNELASADTIYPLIADSLTEYGSLAIDSLPSSPFLLEILKDEKVMKRLSCSKKLKIDSLPTGIYRLRIIYDENQNKQWDTGNLLQRKQAEKVTYYPENIQLRANWDLEITWKE